MVQLLRYSVRAFDALDVALHVQEPRLSLYPMTEEWVRDGFPGRIMVAHRTYIFAEVPFQHSLLKRGTKMHFCAEVLQMPDMREHSGDLEIIVYDAAYVMPITCACEAYEDATGLPATVYTFGELHGDEHAKYR